MPRAQRSPRQPSGVRAGTIRAQVESTQVERPSTSIRDVPSSPNRTCAGSCAWRPPAAPSCRMKVGSIVPLIMDRRAYPPGDRRIGARSASRREDGPCAVDRRPPKIGKIAFERRMRREVEHHGNDEHLLAGDAAPAAVAARRRAVAAERRGRPANPADASRSRRGAQASQAPRVSRRAAKPLVRRARGDADVAETIDHRLAGRPASSARTVARCGDCCSAGATLRIDCKTALDCRRAEPIRASDA